ncbi:MAG TPA: carboxypeptidase-like regulatory domain-containing protein, partial [Planctomycetota bacterium]|nr:carboxypeptidase-like regulatory domain-containing protein [Planctomycetota bacterium]
RDALPPDEADLERTEVDGAPAPAAVPDERPAVCVRGRAVGQGRAVAGAEIRLLLRRLDLLSSETRCKPVATGSDGMFSFAGRAWRDVELQFEIHHEHFAPALHRDVFHDVSPGQQLDVGDIPLVAGGSVSGSVVDAYGNVVPAATVRLRPEDGPLRDHPDRWRLFPRVAVATHGGFRLEHVPAGAYRLDAEAPQLEREYTDMFRVEAGQNITLEPIRLSARFSLTGRVTDAADAPIAGATVALLRARGGNWRDVRTDEDGWYRFDHLLDDTCSLRVDAEGYLRERRHDIAIRSSPRVDVTLAKGLAIAGTVRELGTGQTLERYAARVRCVRSFEGVAETAARQQFRALVDGLVQRDVGLSDSAKRQMEHERAAQIRVAARRLRAQGIDVDTRGGGRAADAADAAHDAEDLLVDFAAAEAHAGGRFEFSGLQEGAYVVEISAPRCHSLRSQQVELRRGATTPELVIELERGLAVSGRVVDKAAREGVPNAGVELMVPRPPAAASSQASALRTRLLVGPDCKQFLDTRTDESGAFRFDQAPPGTYVVRARAKGHARAWSEPLVVTGDVGDLELALGCSGAIHGSVEGLAPDEWRNACVVITDLRTHKPLSVREDATYRADDLPPGKYLVRGYRCIFADGERAMSEWLERSGAELALLREDVELREGAEVEFDVRLGPVQVTTVSGSVLVDGDGRLAHGCRIRLRELCDDAANAAAARRFGTAVDQNGSYALGSVVGGRYRMSVRFDDERAHDREVWQQEVVVYAGSDNVVPPIALTKAQLAGEPAPAKPKSTERAPPVPGAKGKPKPQGGGR